jgi:hypothetical protein
VGVGSGVDFEQLIDGDFGVDLGGVQSGMAEQLLNEPDVSSVVVHVGGTGVAKQVATSGFVDANFFHRSFDPVGDVVGGEPGSVSGDEQRVFCRIDFQFRSGFFPVTCQPCDGPGSEWNGSAFASLALTNGQDATFHVHVFLVQVSHFTASQSTGVGVTSPLVKYCTLSAFEPAFSLPKWRSLGYGRYFCENML